MASTVVVYGGAGHTGRFVVGEVQRRGFVPIVAGRDPDKLASAHPGIEARVAAVDDPAGLDQVLDGADAVINCAGPFVDTAVPIVEAALRAGVHYLDVAAEHGAPHALFERYDDAARDRGIVVVPSMAFYGGLPDLLATTAMGDWDRANTVDIAVALDSWLPTLGTRRTGERNTGPRLRFADGRLASGDPPSPRRWRFPEPFGEQEVTGLLLAESVLLPHHLQIDTVSPYINTAPLADLRDPDTPPPTPADGDTSGRSAQVFLVEVVLRRDDLDEERRATASGRDIYAVSAPLVVEAAARILDGRTSGPGVWAAGEAFDADDFLDDLGDDPTFDVRASRRTG